MTVLVSKPAINIRDQLTELKAQQGYEERQFHFDNLVTNGTFDANTDWTLTNSTISGGSLNAGATASGGTFASQNIAATITAGKTYKYTVVVSSSSGIFNFNFGGLNPNVMSSFVGTQTETLVAVTTSNLVSFRARGSGLTSAVIDSVALFEVDTNGDVIHTMPKGWKPLHVYEDGLLQRESAAHDYEVIYDGFDYYVKPAVAPSATTQTCVIGVRA